MSVKKQSTRESNYTEADVQKAFLAIKGGMSIRNASKLFQIPRTTLLYKYTGKSPISAKKGPALVLTDKEETELAVWFSMISEKGFTLTKQQLLDSVQILVNKIDKRKTPFCDGRPGRHWYEKYIRRHSKLTKKLEKNSSERREPLSEERIKNWFIQVKKYLDEMKLLDIHPSRIFTCDEAAFFLNPEGDKVLVQRGSKTVHNLAKSNDNECLTTMFTINAEGSMTPPMVMFRYQRTPCSIINSIPDDWVHGNSDNGWMTGKTFYDYITTTFHPWLLKNKIEFPVLLFIDKHSSNLTMPLSNFCNDNKIELIPLQSNATHILQPLDMAFFRPMRSVWKEIIEQWNAENFRKKFKKEDFSCALKQAVDFVYDPQVLKAAFVSSGLCPFSSEAIDYSLIKDSAAYKEVRLMGNKSYLENQEQNYYQNEDQDRNQDQNEDQNEDQDLNEDQNQDRKYQDQDNEHVKFLDLLEKHLPDDKLTAFKENETNPLWIGDEKDTNLFYFWMNARMLAYAADNSINFY